MNLNQEEEKNLLKKTTEKENGSSGAEQETITIENVENVEIPETPAIEPDTIESEKTTDEDKQKKKDEVVQKAIESAIAFGLNLAYLKGCEPITPAEVHDTEIGSSMKSLLDYYFPNVNIDHPIIAVIMSSGMLLLLLNEKKKTGGKEDEPRTNEGRASPLGKVDEQIPVNENGEENSGVSGNKESPYVHAKVS